ncbi:MAG TPA: ribosome recycling factor [Spirochaetota bacterium]|nr:ribosome recycling factor [Spirochaetota bacterium]HOM39196.1 ribosome recycling factor [Spirochaetota bacterium]HPQ49231.1 ribosome recycling factor [Spirochaetota bacterium]
MHKMNEPTLEKVISSAENKMNTTLELFSDELKAIRTGRANIGILDNIKVEYYGENMPINQVATLSTPDSHTIIIDPWDKSIIKTIEKAIETSNIGIKPSNDGNIIRLPIPPLSEERRKEFVKLAKKTAEDFKIAIRNVRREANENIKKLEKDKVISEDDSKKGTEKIQQLTDKFIEKIDKMLQVKEKEIMEV